VFSFPTRFSELYVLVDGVPSCYGGWLSNSPVDPSEGLVMVDVDLCVWLASAGDMAPYGQDGA